MQTLPYTGDRSWKEFKCSLECFRRSSKWTVLPAKRIILGLKGEQQADS